MPEQSLYDRLGGAFAIAAVVDHFSDAVVKNPIVGQQSANPQPARVAQRTTWVACQVSSSCAPCGSATSSGGPIKYAGTEPGSTILGLEEAHRDLRISPEEFDEVAAELARTLDVVGVPEKEKGEVLAAFAAHKGEVTDGYLEAVGSR